MDQRQVSIEVQSARNAVYQALGDKIEQLILEDPKKLNKLIFESWASCKKLENYIIETNK